MTTVLFGQDATSAIPVQRLSAQQPFNVLLVVVHFRNSQVFQDTKRCINLSKTM